MFARNKRSSRPAPFPLSSYLFPPWYLFPYPISYSRAAYRQKSRISGVGVGPVSDTCVSKIVTAPLEGTTCAAVPEPPTQPYRPGTFHGSIIATSTDPLKPHPCPSR